jgi:hypothetical protein
MNRPTVEEVVLLARGQILEDMRRGLVPSHCDSFEELHDYTDANLYGNIGDHRYSFPSVEAWCEWANEVQDQLDAWLELRG